MGDQSALRRSRFLRERNMKFGLKCFTAALAFGSVTTMATSALAVDVPSQVRVIVAYNAGGSSDTLARTTIAAWEKVLEEMSGTSINTLVMNMPGAGGEIGWTNLATAAPDGGTIGVVNLPAIPLVELTRDTKFEPWLEAFAPIGVNVIDPNVVRLSKASKYASLKDAIAAAVENPGSVTVGADGPLSDDHAAMYAIEKITGAKFAFVPFAGSAPANRAFLAGEIDIAIGNVFDHTKTVDGASEAMVLQPERYDFIPDVGTASEVIGVDGLTLGSVRGFTAPGGIDPELLAMYQAAMEQVYNDPAFVEEMRSKNMTTVKPLIGDAFGALMVEQGDLAADLLPLFKEGGFAN